MFLHFFYSWAFSKCNQISQKSKGLKKTVANWILISVKNLGATLTISDYKTVRQLSGGETFPPTPLRLAE